MTATKHLRLGFDGETLAARYLADSGLTLLDRNWRCDEGEIDLVATDHTTLIVCEVKTRTSAAFGHPAEAVTDEKAGRIRRVATRWRAAHGAGRCRTRFDIVSILWPPGARPAITHYRGVF